MATQEARLTSDIFSVIKAQNKTQDVLKFFISQYGEFLSILINEINQLIVKGKIKPVDINKDEYIFPCQKTISEATPGKCQDIIMPKVIKN